MDRLAEKLFGCMWDAGGRELVRLLATLVNNDMAETFKGVGVEKVYKAIQRCNLNLKSFEDIESVLKQVVDEIVEEDMKLKNMVSSNYFGGISNV